MTPTACLRIIRVIPADARTMPRLDSRVPDQRGTHQHALILLLTTCLVVNEHHRGCLFFIMGRGGAGALMVKAMVPSVLSD